MARNESVRVEFTEVPDFLLNKDVRAGNLEYINGAWNFIADGGQFRQVLKVSEYKQLMKASGKDVPEDNEKADATGSRRGRPAREE